MKKYSILIVEDLPALNLTYRLIFEADGWTAICADNVASAVEAMNNVAFDVVFTDVNLEADGDGVDVVRAAAQQRVRPVTIAVSGYLDGELEQWIQSNGADLALAKPLQIPQLKVEIHRLLARKKRAAAA
jgi:two-component system OmpR family response regulator